MVEHDNHKTMQSARMELQVLDQIKDKPKRVALISENLGISTSTVNTVARRLVNDGLVKRNNTNRLMLVDPE